MNEPDFLDVQQVRTRHVVRGEGEPALLLHGIGRSLEDRADPLPALAAVGERLTTPHPRSSARVVNGLLHLFHDPQIGRAGEFSPPATTFLGEDR